MSRHTRNQPNNQENKTQRQKHHRQEQTHPIHPPENQTETITNMNSNDITQPNDNQIVDTVYMYKAFQQEPEQLEQEFQTPESPRNWTTTPDKGGE